VKPPERLGRSAGSIRPLRRTTLRSRLAGWCATRPVTAPVGDHDLLPRTDVGRRVGDEQVTGPVPALGLDDRPRLPVERNSHVLDRHRGPSVVDHRVNVAVVVLLFLPLRGTTDRIETPDPDPSGQRSGNSEQPVELRIDGPGQLIDNLAAEPLQPSRRGPGFNESDSSNQSPACGRPWSPVLVSPPAAVGLRQLALAPDYCNGRCDRTAATTSRIAWPAAAAWVLSR
jgi:hypothetical protein